MANRVTRSVGNRKSDGSGGIDFYARERMSNQRAVKHEICQRPSLAHWSASKFTEQVLAPLSEPLRSKCRNQTLLRNWPTINSRFTYTQEQRGSSTWADNRQRRFS